MIQENKVVQLAYKLTDSKGEVLDQADAQQPFVYMHGSAQIIPGLESALEGLKKGDKKKVTVAPEEGYGEMNPQLVLDVARAQFPADLDLQPGMQFEANVGDGQGMMFRVDAVQGDQVKINGNHPLAGETLHFDVEVLDIRDATAEEIEHGHAHGPGGAHAH